MGISIPPLPNVNPQVITGGGAPSATDTFLQTFLQSMQQGPQAYQAAQNAKLESRRLDLMAKQEERLTREQELQLQNARAEGEALRSLIMQTGQQAQQQVSGDVRQMLNASGMMPLGTADTVTVPMQMAGPAGALANVVQGIPAEHVAATAERGRAVLGDQQKYLDQATRLGNIEKAVGAIKDESKRPGARSLLMFAEMGANLPREVQAQLFPELFPSDGGAVDPQTMNAATALFKTGLFTWGQARRQAGLQAVKGVPDDVKFEPFPTRPRQDQLKAGAMLTSMQSAVPIMDAYSEKQAPGPLASWVKGGSKGSWRELIANPALSSEDRQFIQASRQFADAWAFVISGAATADQQFSRIFGSTTESFGDDPQTRQQKRNMRAMMIQAVADIAGGAVTPTQVIDRALKMDWTPEQKKFLTEERARAVRWEADKAKGRVRLDLSTGTPTDADDLQQQLDEIRAAMRRDP